MTRMCAPVPFYRWHYSIDVQEKNGEKTFLTLSFLVRYQIEWTICKRIIKLAKKWPEDKHLQISFNIYHNT